MKTAVIGAGMAGLTVARTLRMAGYEVTVFDKSKGTGGRLASRSLAGGWIDLLGQLGVCRGDAKRAAFVPFAGAQAHTAQRHEVRGADDAAVGAQRDLVCLEYCTAVWVALGGCSRSPDTAVWPGYDSVVDPTERARTVDSVIPVKRVAGGAVGTPHNGAQARDDVRVQRAGRDHLCLSSEPHRRRRRRDKPG